MLFYTLPPTWRNASAVALWRSGLSQNLVVLVNKAHPEDIRTAFNRALHQWAECVGIHYPGHPRGDYQGASLPVRLMLGFLGNQHGANVDVCPNALHA